MTPPGACALDFVGGANPHLEIPHSVGERLKAGGWTTSAYKFHRAAIGKGNSGRELIAMIGGKHKQAQADFFQVIGALGNRCSGGAMVVGVPGGRPCARRS